ncbi:MAG: hypothetical protein ACRD1H_18450, partial [Vicinamibacterales bacterium]
GIRGRLAAAPAPRRSFWSWVVPTTASRRLAWAAAALLIVATAVLTLSSETRSTVADRLGLPGISISTDPTATLTPGGRLDLGLPIEPGGSVAVSSGHVIPPPVALLGEPDGVYVLNRQGTAQVSYVYAPRPGLPEVASTGVGLLISQFEGDTNESFIQKQLGPDTSIELVTVNGQRAFWLAGAPHVFFYEDANGAIQEETMRLAGNVLLWEEFGLTLRIESALDRDAAIEIAEAMSTSP